MHTTPPELLISELDSIRIEKILATLPFNKREELTSLEDELDRADLVAPARVPPNIVTMNSTVRFRVSSSEKEFCLTLVYPEDMTNDGKTISILAPAGSAMLGLVEEDEIDWPMLDGKTMKIKVEEIVYQPERAGEFHL